MANEIGIERASIVPGATALFDIDDLTQLVAPRPLAIFAGDDDTYAFDAAAIAERTLHACRRAGAEAALHVDIRPGQHELTDERSTAITNWVASIIAGA